MNWGISQIPETMDKPVEEVNQVVQYFDGLGRPIQTIKTLASPNKNDIVIPQKYDSWGRESRKYLPYTSPLAPGAFKSNALNEDDAYAESEQFRFYQQTYAVARDEKPYSASLFEASSLDRVLKQGAVGKAWQPHAMETEDHSIEKVYSFNGHNDVLLIKYNTSTGMIAFDPNLFYTDNELYASKTIDEHNHEMIEYTDKEGKTLLKRVQYGDLRGVNAYAETYYVYDDLGNLMVILPPEGVKALKSSLVPVSSLQYQVDNFAFQYRYDGRKRMTHKKIPGADWIYMVYDSRDRLVLTQDANQRSNFLWTFIKYDALNRPIATGIKDTTDAFTPAQMQAGIDDHYSKSWAKYGDTYIGAADKNVHGYSNFSYPTVTTSKIVDPNRYLTVTYYDNYTFKNQYGDGYNYINDGLKETVNGYLYEQPANEFGSVKGRFTGAKVKVLDGGINGGVAGGYTWLKSVNYYDDKYRVIQTIGDNYKGGTDRVSNLYDFVGKVLQSKGLHLESDVQWTDLVLNTVIGNYLQKTGSTGWTSGAASVQSLPAGQDGWVEFVASEENTARMIGLSSQNNGVHYNTIDYAIHPRTDKTVGIYEKGTLKKEVGTYSAGDVFRIARVGTAVKYYKNGMELYPSAISSTGPLLVDVSMNTTGSTVVGVKSSFSTSIHSVLRRYVYDHASRLKQVYHTLDSGPEVLLASNEYNELGQLIDKGLHSVNGSTPMQSVDYRYNIRGWLTSMNNSQLNSDGLTNDDTGDFFGMNLAYNEELGTGNTQTIFTNTGLVSSYTFNGNASDAGENGLNGTIYGAQLTTDSQGNSNSAYTFTASDYIDIPNSKDKHSFIQNTGKFTISAFVKIDDLNGRNVIVSSTATSSAKGFCFMYETYGGTYGDHQLRFMSTKGISGTSFNALGGIRTIDDNNWHHVAVVGDGEYVRFYVDGVPDGSPTRITIFSTGSATSTTLIGKTRSSATALILGMVGAIDELNVLNRPLSRSEIAVMANRTPFSTTLDESQYNGNISAMKWSVNQGLGDTKEMAYNFKYDPLNRLLSADNLQSSSLGVWGNGKYHERDLTYDLNGNIKSLTRSSELGMIDNLIYDYGSGATQSNKLLSVADRTMDATIKSKGFIDANTTGNDYAYDVNGNMTVDLNKGLSSPITYNYLNLPEVVTRTGNTIRYIYDASGRKLSQVVRAGFGIKQTDYAGEFVYEDDMLRFINHEEGRIVMSSEKLLYKHDGETLEGMTGLNSTLSVITVNGEKYVNATSGGTGSGILPIGNAINVVPGEKYLIRIKGYRSNYNAGIIIRRNNTTISYGSYLPALVSNEAWMEQIYVVPRNTSVLEIGVGWPVPTGTAGLNVNAFELIKLESAAPEYQYNLNDHLGNVRLTFTSKRDIESAIATLETTNESSEEGKFLYYDEAIKVNNYLFDHTNNAETPEPVNTGGNPPDPDQIYEPDGYATRLTGGNTNAKYGLAKSLSVMQGDLVNAKVYAKYVDPIKENQTVELRDFLLSIASGGSAPAGTFVDGGAAGSIGNSVLPISPINHSSETGTSPKAYLNYIVFNKDMSSVLDQGFQRITTNSREYGQNGPHDNLMVSIKIKEAGYVYLYLSNENETPLEVYFDDFNVEHTKSPVIQSDEYYPFGLTFNSYQRENSTENKWKFQGQEHIDVLNMGWDSFKWRNHQPDIGRFFNADPLAEKYPYYSPYTFSGNEVTSAIELEGLEPLKLFTTKQAAAEDFGKLFNDNSIREDLEFYTEIYKVGDSYTYAIPIKGQQHGVENVRDIELPEGVTSEDWVHTHGAESPGHDDENFSLGEFADEGYSKFYKKDAYLVTPGGTLQHYDLETGNIDAISSDMPKDDGTGSSAKTTSIYNIQKGDTLFSIAKRYMTTVDAIKKENNLKDDIIKPGEFLNITN
jgi:RHS repeat-associated protein